MAATPVYALPYPVSTDPADVPADVKRLADRIEAAIGPGSATGQVPVWDQTSKTWVANSSFKAPVANALSGYVAAAQQTAATYPADLGTVGPSVTIPQAGNWFFLFGAGLLNASAGNHQPALTGLYNGGDVAHFDYYAPTGGGGVDREFQSYGALLGCAAGNVVKMVYGTDGAGHTYSWSQRWMVALRVS